MRTVGCRKAEITATRAGTFYFLFELINSEQAVLYGSVIADKFVGSRSNPRAPAASHRRVDMFPQPFQEPPHVDFVVVGEHHLPKFPTGI